MKTRIQNAKLVQDNRVDLKRYGWKNTMEDALSLQKSFEERGI